MSGHFRRLFLAPVSLSFLLLLAATTAPANGQTLADDPGVQSALRLLDLWMDAQVAYEQIPGASIAVVQDQALPGSRSTKGMKNMDRPLWRDC